MVWAKEERKVPGFRSKETVGIVLEDTEIIRLI